MTPIISLMEMDISDNRKLINAFNTCYEKLKEFINAKYHRYTGMYFFD